MYLEEMKERANNMASPEGITMDNDDNILAAATGRILDEPPPPPAARLIDQKPLQNHRLLPIDSECVSSIINNHVEHKMDSTKNNQDGTFGSVELDFSSYNTHHHNNSAGMVSAYSNDQNGTNGNHHQHHHQNFNNGGVSLTLGLQQHGASGVSLAFPPPSQASLFYPRDQMEDCQPVVQYSLLDGEAQNLPYRNLMGAQLLHDLAG